VFAGTDSESSFPGTKDEAGAFILDGNQRGPHYQLHFSGTNTLCSTDQTGILASSDKGRTWKPIRHDFGPQKVRCLFCREGIVYAGTDTDGVLHPGTVEKAGPASIGGSPAALKYSPCRLPRAGCSQPCIVKASIGGMTGNRAGSRRAACHH